MLRENLIFKYSLIISAAVHIGGFGLLKGNSHFFQNGLAGVKDNVVVFEIGWIENSLAQKEQDKADYRNKETGEIKTSSEIEHAPSFSSQSGSSGYAEENSGGLTDEYLLEVRRRIESVKFYPVEARRRFISGSVTISFDIDKDGISKDIYIVKSSGFTILDETAKEIVLKANPFPKMPCGNSSQYIQITIAFEL